MKKLGIIHSGYAGVDGLVKLVNENIPELTIVNITDDSLAKRVLSAGKATPDVCESVMLYALSAQSNGCDAIYSACVLIRGAADLAAPLLRIPYINYDVPMVRKAIEMGKRIALVTANAPALYNTGLMVEREIEAAGKGNVLTKFQCVEAYNALKAKDKEKYMELMRECVYKMAKENDVVMLGQGSFNAADYPDAAAPVLDPNLSGVLGLKAILEA